MQSSAQLQYFRTPQGATVAALDFDLAERLQHWAELRLSMVRQVPAPFTRDEWAYLTLFLDRPNLEHPFRQSFGEMLHDADGLPAMLVRPRGMIAIWLPNTVSLLGPLTLILASLTGAPLWIKTGSRADDLTAAFVNYAVEHLPKGNLAEYLREHVQIEQFDRNSPRNAEMAAAAKVRVVFGSDSAVAAVHALPHPADSVAISFGDHVSEAWVELAALSDEHLMTLIKVFAIYGRAGCTSPRRVVVLDGTPADAGALRQRLVNLWSKVVRQEVPMHVASGNILHRQLALAQGWQASTAPRQAAVLVSGPSGLPEPTGLMTLAIMAANLDQTVATLPVNIQTVGHCIRHPDDPMWWRGLVATPVKRFVPLAAMHHFGPVWDGANFWRQLFEEVVLRV